MKNIKNSNYILRYIEIFMFGIVVGVTIPVTIMIIYAYLYLIQNTIDIIPLINLGGSL
jgi:hypothetical protein